MVSNQEESRNKWFAIHGARLKLLEALKAANAPNHVIADAERLLAGKSPNENRCS